MHPRFTKRRAITAVVLMNLTALAVHQEITVKGVFILTLVSAILLWALPQMTERA